LNNQPERIANSTPERSKVNGLQRFSTIPIYLSHCISRDEYKKFINLPFVRLPFIIDFS
jgi:hypothetical protein